MQNHGRGDKETLSSVADIYLFCLRRVKDSQITLFWNLAHHPVQYTEYNTYLLILSNFIDNILYSPEPYYNPIHSSVESAAFKCSYQLQTVWRAGCPAPAPLPPQAAAGEAAAAECAEAAREPGAVRAGAPLQLALHPGRQGGLTTRNNCWKTLSPQIILKCVSYLNGQNAARRKIGDGDCQHSTLAPATVAALNIHIHHFKSVCSAEAECYLYLYLVPWRLFYRNKQTNFISRILTNFIINLGSFWKIRRLRI